MRPVRALFLIMFGVFAGAYYSFKFLGKILIAFDPELKGTKELATDIIYIGMERALYGDSRNYRSDPRRRTNYSRSRPFVGGFGPETFGFICERCSHRVVNLAEDERNDKISRHLDNCAGPVRRLNERDDTIA